MHLNQCRERVFALLSGFLLIASCLSATTYNVIGTYANWPTNWVAMNGLNDLDDGLTRTQLDFVGNTVNPGAYYGFNNEYVFFRQRVNIDTVSSLSVFQDAHLVLIDLVGQDYNTTTKTLQTGSDGYPDYGFAWDSKSNINASHGLEMVVRSTTATYWNGINMDDIDGSAGQKLANDINGNSRTTDGYMRVIDQQGTSAFSNTTFIDFAVKWSYLQQYTGLTSNQSWRVAFASISQATDHNNINADVSGGASPSSLATSGWASISSSPMSSAVDLCAYQGAEGVYVEFVAYDVEDGTIRLNLLGADGQVTWTGTTNVQAGAQQVCRFLVPGLTLGCTYNFGVRDEVGNVWSAPGVTVQAFAAEMIRMSLDGVTLSFNSLPERDYEIQWTERLGTDWRTVTNVLSQGDRTRVLVLNPAPQSPSGFFRIQLR
jgi:hypothetical protein